MSPSATNAKRAFLAVLVVLGILFVMLLRPVLMALCLAIIIAIIFYPIYNYFLRKSRDRRYLAAFLTTASMFILLILPLSLIMLLIINQSLTFLSRLDVRHLFSSLQSVDTVKEYFLPVLTALEQRADLSVDFVGLFTQLGSQLARYLYSFSPQVVGQTATFIFNFIVMHFCIFFLFVEGKQVFKIVLDLSPLESRYEQRLATEVRNMLYATVYGYLVTSLVQAILAAIGFYVAGTPVPIIFATLTFFMSMVPVLGATSVWLPLSVYLMATDHLGAGIGLFIYGALVISGIDNIIKPWLMRGKAKIHILLIFFALLGGLKMFGPIGILFGPVIMALFLACIRIYREDFLPLYKLSVDNTG